MVVAQLEALMSVRRGSLAAFAAGVDASPGDIAIARMMLHRRCAVAAQVVTASLARLGRRFAPYLEGRLAKAPTDVADEWQQARAAGEVVRDTCGDVAPLLFERALLAEAEGRFADAQADLKKLAGPFPEFIPGAVAAARAAMAVADAERAIAALAPIERQIHHMREGAALLADALRLVGLHQAASRYDLAALTSRGNYDSRGNDCAPTDVGGRVIYDSHMPQSFYFEGQPDGTVICILRGVYYRVNRVFGRLLSAMVQSQQPSIFISVDGTAVGPRGGGSSASGDSRRPQEALRLGRASSQWLTKWASRLLAGTVFVFKMILLALYGLIPSLLRTRLSRSIYAPGGATQPWLQSAAMRQTLLELLGPEGRLRWRLAEISDPALRVRLIRDRYRAGLGRIFGTSATLWRRGVTKGAGPSDASVTPIAPAELPPRAAAVLQRLLNDVDSIGVALSRSSVR